MMPRALACTLGLVLSAFLELSAAVAAGCPGALPLSPHAGKAVLLADNTLFFRTPALEHDFDGSPAAYGVRDQGMEFICNGLAPKVPARCRKSNKGAECAGACRAAFAAWSRSGAPPDALNNKMCSIGLGGGNCSPVRARLQPPPRADWFVSETTVKLAPPPGPVPAGWELRQEAQVDPANIRYFVIPGGFRARPWDATPGDAGYILDARTGAASYFVIGDTGGALDEGSTALLTALRNGTPPPSGMETSALGEQVRRYTAGIGGDFRVAIFRHTTTRIPETTTLSLTADKVEAWSRATAEARLSAIGGVARLKACTEP